MLSILVILVQYYILVGKISNWTEEAHLQSLDTKLVMRHFYLQSYEENESRRCTYEYITLY